MYSFGTQAQRSLQELTLHGEAATNERLSQLVAATRTEMGKHLRCAEGQSALFERLAGVRPSRPSLCHPVCQPSPTPTARGCARDANCRRARVRAGRALQTGRASEPRRCAGNCSSSASARRQRGPAPPPAARLLALHDVDVGTPEFRTLGGAYLRAECQLRPRELGAPPEPLAGGGAAAAAVVVGAGRPVPAARRAHRRGTVRAEQRRR
eukprot:COSAG01_NODE_24913_length_762_cov_0.859729_1_plen_210_part_00